MGNRFQALSTQDLDDPMIAPPPQNLGPNLSPQPLAAGPSYAGLFQGTTMHGSPPLAPTRTKEGHHAICFTREDKIRLEGRSKHTLIGKFSHGRPTMPRLKQLLLDMKFVGEMNLTAWDSKHIFIEFDRVEDYRKLWRRSFYTLDNFTMRILKWTPEFKPEVENPTSPVWITLPKIPEILYDDFAIASIVNPIGTPLRIDIPQCNRARFNECRALIELDVTKDLDDKVLDQL